MLFVKINTKWCQTQNEELSFFIKWKGVIIGAESIAISKRFLNIICLNGLFNQRLSRNTQFLV
ncbi:hypothetical protein SAMN06296273_0196 [Nitrosomonas ureae]|uniref:Uncharacterized protein n=1 Tax=Nitrosomonas ureae TaxID=44577 RepID=A0A285BV57_9PROT|nr:hypothetical protein SAMN06296273_0196 [Nitrosomonas ureae]